MHLIFSFGRCFASSKTKQTHKKQSTDEQSEDWCYLLYYELAVYGQLCLPASLSCFLSSKHDFIICLILSKNH